MKNDKIAGWISFALIVVWIASFIAMLVSPAIELAGSIGSLLILFGFIYVAYKTLIKKEELSDGEWIAFGIIFLIQVGEILLSFLWGLSL